MTLEPPLHRNYFTKHAPLIEEKKGLVRGRVQSYHAYSSTEPRILHRLELPPEYLRQWPLQTEVRLPSLMSGMH